MSHNDEHNPDKDPSPWHDLDAYVSTPRVTGLQLSHDGATLVATGQSTNHDHTEYTTSLWRVHLDGTTPARRLTARRHAGVHLQA